MFPVRGCELAWQVRLLRSQVFSRLGCMMMGDLKARSTGLVTHGRMIKALAEEFRAMVGCLRLAKPRKLTEADTCEPLFFFTGMLMLDRMVQL